MKQIAGYLRAYHREAFDLPVYLTLACFLGAALYLHYTHGLGDRWVYDHFGHSSQFPRYFTFFAVPYIFALVVDHGFRGEWRALARLRVWGAIGFALLLLSFNGYFPWHQELSDALLPEAARYWGDKVFWNAKRLVAVFLPLFIWWRVVDRGRGDFYGWTLRRTDLRPYLLMLLLLLPVIAWASFQPDFLESYPSYVPGRAESEAGIPVWFTCGLFELVYGLDYALVEHFFRGFLVIGMIRWLGARAVLPMVTVYCFLHFGKPAGEAISSVFGGYILGVIAYYGRSIWGGIIVHTGIAWSMEIGAAIVKI